MLISITLLILILITLFSIVAGNSFTGSVIKNVIDNDLIVNGTGTSVGIESTDVLFNVDPVIGFTVTIIVIVGLATAIGIQVLGSGLSPSSVRIMIIGIAYSGVWIVFSLLAEPLISSIEIFGTLIYISLTIGYVIGVIQKMSGGGDL